MKSISRKKFGFVINIDSRPCHAMMMIGKSALLLIIVYRKIYYWFLYTGFLFCIKFWWSKRYRAYDFQLFTFGRRNG